MNEPKDINEPGIVGDAVGALRDAAVPDGPSPQLLEHVGWKLRTMAGRPQPTPFAQRFRDAALSSRALAIAASVLVLIGFAVWMVTWNAGVAYAQVKREIEEAQTVRFRASIGDDQTRSFKVMLKVPGLMRIEMPDGPVTITDFSQGKMVTLLPKAKTALTVDLSNKPQFMTPRNFLAEMKAVAASDAQPLGEKEADGRKMKGFRMSKGGKTYDLWVDSQSGSPARIEVTGGPDNSTLICRDVVFNEAMEEGLFSVTPPAGYQVRKSDATFGVVGRWPTEGDLVVGLRMAAEANNGVFPARLDAYATKLAAQAAAARDGKEKDALMRQSEAVTLAVAFESLMAESGGYVYAGEGVQLDDGSKPVCWWQTPGGKTYRVVCGDLSIAEIPADAVPTPREPARGTTRPPPV